MADDVWQKHAAQWDRVGPPLRPGPEDVAFYQRVVNDWAVRHGAPRALELGVTPEIARLAWPAGTALLAIDKAQDMIDRVWPGFPRPKEGALCADWMVMPLPAESRDLVISDGCFGVLPYPAGYSGLLSRLSSVMRPGGQFVFRAFVRPEQPESPAALFDALLAGRIGSFHAFKLRLLMAVQSDTERGVRVCDVWDRWATEGPSAARLAERLAWPKAQIESMEAYKGQTTAYSFPSLAELEGAWHAAGFVELERSSAGYELASSCPRFVLASAQRK